MLKLYASDTDSYELLTGKSLAMFLLKDNNKIYLLRGTTVSPYMSEKLRADIIEALELNFTILEIADLYDDSESLELLRTTIEIYDEYANDMWNWYKWGLNKYFKARFSTLIRRGR